MTKDTFSTIPQLRAISRRKFLGGAAALSGLALGGPLLAACGADTKDAGSSSTAAGSTSSQAASSSAATSGGGDKLIGLSLNGFVEYDKQVAQGVAKALDGTGYG